jgi:hypothetical protein
MDPAQQLIPAVFSPAEQAAHLLHLHLRGAWRVWCAERGGALVSPELRTLEGWCVELPLEHKVAAGSCPLLSAPLRRLQSSCGPTPSDRGRASRCPPATPIGGPQIQRRGWLLRRRPHAELVEACDSRGGACAWNSLHTAVRGGTRARSSSGGRGAACSGARARAAPSTLSSDGMAWGSRLIVARDETFMVCDRV